ncbi:MAG TPA: HEAT repeat domain-containing protein [Planctomycetia bacterium]|nr:HEAT repeat domain-containing protein [Planctomycetia bacterium]
MRLGFTFAMLVASSLVATAGADVVRIAGGGKIEGTVLEDESDDAKLVVETKFGKVRVARNKIEAIDRGGADDPANYRAEAAKYKDTVDDQFKLALWCLDARLKKQATEHLRRVLALDPDHYGAREKLGYVKVDGKWMTLDESKAAQGLVKDSKGRWVLPQQREEAEKKEAAKKLRAEFFTKVRAWSRLLRSETPAKADAARSNLKGIRDPAAVEPLLKFLAEPDSKPSDRLLLAEILSRIEGPESTAALQKLGLDEAEDEVRAATAQALKPRRTPAVVKGLALLLKNKDNDKINRAAELLAALGDKSVVPDLIDSLVTRHEKVHQTTWEEYTAATRPQPFAPARTVVLPNGTIVRVPQAIPAQGAPLVGSPPPETTVTVETKENQGVLHALQDLTGEDFGFDKNRWVDWVRKRSNDKAAKALDKG